MQLLPDLRERWGRAQSKPRPVSLLRFFSLGFSPSLASFARETGLGEETEKGSPGGRALRFRARGWFSRCCGWCFADGEALRLPGTYFPMGDGGKLAGRKY